VKEYNIFMSKKAFWITKLSTKSKMRHSIKIQIKEEKKVGRPKGGTNKYWSKEAKYEYVKLIISGEISLMQLGKENNISAGMLTKWVKRYQEGGIEALKTNANQVIR
jgi:transposase-like protein